MTETLTILRWVGLAAVLLLPVRARAQEIPADQWIGCYQLRLGDWNPAPPSQDLRFHTPPARFRLSPQPNTSPRRSAQLRIVEPVIVHSFARGRAWAGWQMMPPAGVRILWSDGLTGAALELTARGDTLVGTVRALSDHQGAAAVPEAPAVVRRVPCEAG